MLGTVRIMDTFSLTQYYIKEPAHIYGNTLTIIITKKSSSLLNKHQVGLLLSNHNQITFSLNMFKLYKPKKFRNIRKYKSFNMKKIKMDINK